MKLANVINNFISEKGYDVASFAEISGISLPLLNQILEGDITPGVSVLAKLSIALEIPVELLIDGSEAVLTTVIHKDNRPVAVRNKTHKDGVDIFSMAPIKTMRSMEPLMVVLKGENDSTTISTHEGEEFAYVLKGEIELSLGDKIIKMTEGDSLYYDSILPHSYKSTKENAEILVVVYTPW